MKPKDHSAVLALKKKLTENLSLVDFRVFGSKARGDDLPDSDIDVMIEIDRFSKEMETFIDDCVFEINLAHDTLISVMIFGRDELEDGVLRHSPLYRSVCKEGIKV